MRRRHSLKTKSTTKSDRIELPNNLSSRQFIPRQNLLLSWGLITAWRNYAGGIGTPDDLCRWEKWTHLHARFVKKVVSFFDNQKYHHRHRQILEWKIISLSAFFATFYSTWEECCFLHCTLFENQLRMSHYLMLAFSTNFCSTKISMFNELISTQNVNVALFARNVEWDFFCDFQTPCVGLCARLCLSKVL